MRRPVFIFAHIELRPGPGARFLRAPQSSQDAGVVPPRFVVARFFAPALARPRLAGAGAALGVAPLAALNLTVLAVFRVPAAALRGLAAFVLDEAAFVLDEAAFALG